MAHLSPLFLELRGSAFDALPGETIGTSGPNGLVWRAEHYGADAVSYSLTVHGTGHFQWAVNDGRGWRVWTRRKGATARLVREKLDAVRRWADRKRAEKEAA